MRLQSLVGYDLEQITKTLKTYRSAIATRDKIPPYYVFNNEKLDRIIEAMPKTSLMITVGSIN